MNPDIVGTALKKIKVEEKQLRDYFAGQALQGIALLTAVAVGDEHDNPIQSYDNTAKAAYNLADAMLKEREK